MGKKDKEIEELKKQLAEMEEIDEESEEVQEVKKPKVEAIKEEPKQVEIPKGYYLTQVPTGYAPVIALGEEAISEQELLVKMANALIEAGLLK